MNPLYALNSEEALILSCSTYVEKKEIAEDSICYEYINGFIDGAIITDTTIINDLKKGKSKLSEFSKRAYRTRVRNTRQPVPSTYFAKFCLPEDTSTQTIILELVHNLNFDIIPEYGFKNVLYKTMKRIYKC
jgi:hypothetical protein